MPNLNKNENVNKSKIQYQNHQHNYHNHYKNQNIHQREDSAYVSSPDSECSSNGLNNKDRKRNVSCTSEEESDDPGSIGADESGAESIETESVFFRNFRGRKPNEIRDFCVKQKVC